MNSLTSQRWILLVEDDPNDADLTLRVLADPALPCQVVHARNGAEALDCLYRRHLGQSPHSSFPLLVLLDLKMPQVNGFEVLQQMKGDPGLKTIPVTVFTSSREEGDVARCYLLGANAYVVKPVEFQKFMAALQEIKNFWAGLNERPVNRLLPQTAPPLPQTQPALGEVSDAIEK